MLSQERQHIRRALDLAWNVAGRVYPRPPVGAVIVSQAGERISEGATEPLPGQHAEISAIAAAGAHAKGAKMFCTLEPHSFHGNSPPCTKAIIDVGIAEVVICQLDPNPKQYGKALNVLKQAGINTRFVGLEHQREAYVLMEGFRKYITENKTFVTAKIAMSMDGKIATKSGESQWITNSEARAIGHQLRARSDAILTTINTVLRDNPALTARVDGEVVHYPTRIILDRYGRLPENAKLFDDPGKILWLTGDNPTNKIKNSKLEHCKVEIDSADSDLLDVDSVLDEMVKRGYCWALVEAGGKLLGKLFSAKVIDRYEVFIAPTIIGGQNAPSPVAGEGITHINDVLKLSQVQYHEVAGNLHITGYSKEDNFIPHV